MTSIYRKLQSPIRLAVLDYDPHYGRSEWYINRINVPREHRRNGIATAMLNELFALANAAKATIYLEINAYGEMNHEQLRSWYIRKGFSEIGNEGIYRKLPQ